MHIKDFSEYTKGEQRNLLMHWWYYYSKSPYSLAECRNFRMAVEKDSQMVMNMAFCAALIGESNTDILNAMRAGKFDEFWQKMDDFCKTEDFKACYEMGAIAFIEIIVNSYNNSRTRGSVPNTRAFSGIVDIVNDNGSILTSEHVSKLHEICAMNNADFSNDDLIGDFSVGEGVYGTTIFMTNRLNEHKMEIAKCIGMLPKISSGNTFLNLFDDRNGRRWTDEQNVVDMLVQMGTACGFVYFPVPRKSWKNLPGQVPVIASNLNNEECVVEGYKPHEYLKVIERIQNGTFK